MVLGIEYFGNIEHYCFKKNVISYFFSRSVTSSISFMTIASILSDLWPGTPKKPRRNSVLVDHASEFVSYVNKGYNFHTHLKVVFFVHIRNKLAGMINQNTITAVCTNQAVPVLYTSNLPQLRSPRKCFAFSVRFLQLVQKLE